VSATNVGETAVKLELFRVLLCDVCCLQECPSGVVDEDTFKGIYAQFFPQGSKSCRVT